MKTHSPWLHILLATVLALPFSGCSEKDPEPESGEKSPRAQASDGGEQAEAMLIRPGLGVGPVRFGMTIGEMKECLGEPDIAATGVSFVYADLGIEVVTRDEQVHSINCVDHIKDAPEVKACQHKTSEGIGIGSTESELIAAYGEPYKRGSSGLMYNELGMRFELDEDQVKLIGVLKPWKTRP